MLLALPLPGYLEAAGGPLPIREVEWVQLATSRVKGMRVDRLLYPQAAVGPRRIAFAGLEDMSATMLAALDEVEWVWELRRESWSMRGLFENEPLLVIHIPNPFRSTSGRVSDA